MELTAAEWKAIAGGLVLIKGVLLTVWGLWRRSEVQRIREKDERYRELAKRYDKDLALEDTRTQEAEERGRAERAMSEEIRVELTQALAKSNQREREIRERFLGLLIDLKSGGGGRRWTAEGEGAVEDGEEGRGDRGDAARPGPRRLPDRGR